MGICQVKCHSGSWYNVFWWVLSIYPHTHTLVQMMALIQMLIDYNFYCCYKGGVWVVIFIPLTKYGVYFELGQAEFSFCEAIDALKLASKVSIHSQWPQNRSLTPLTQVHGGQVSHAVRGKKMFSLSFNYWLLSAPLLAFICHHNSFLIYGSLEQPTLAKWSHITHISVGSALVISGAFAVAGYTTFTGYTQGTCTRYGYMPLIFFSIFWILLSHLIFIFQETYLRTTAQTTTWQRSAASVLASA